MSSPAVRSVLHGMLMLRLFPERGFGLMAISAGFAASEGGSSSPGSADTESFGQEQFVLGNEQPSQTAYRDGDGRQHHELWLQADDGFTNIVSLAGSRLRFASALRSPATRVGLASVANHWLCL